MDIEQEKLSDKTPDIAPVSLIFTCCQSLPLPLQFTDQQQLDHSLYPQIPHSELLFFLPNLIRIRYKLSAKHKQRRAGGHQKKRGISKSHPRITDLIFRCNSFGQHNRDREHASNCVLVSQPKSQSSQSVRPAMNV